MPPARLLAYPCCQQHRLHQGDYIMPSHENRSRLLVAGTLSIANLALIASLGLSGLGAPAHAQGQNKETIVKPTRAVAWPSRSPSRATMRSPMATP